MEPHVAALVAEIYVHVARIEGMKAENAHRASNGLSVAYGEEAFESESIGLQHIATALRNFG